MFTREEREIYRFSDGRAARSADPLALESAYLDALAGVDQDAIREQSRSPIHEIRIRASERFLPAIRRVFGVEEFDEATGRGLPLAETLALTGDLWAWRERVRSRYRTLAQIVHLFGFPPGRPLSYEAYLGLYYNADRVSAIAALQTARGIGAALSGRPHSSIVDAMAGHESQIPWVQMTVDAEAAEAELAAKFDRGERF